MDGELQFDAVADPEVAALKAPAALKGRANVLVFPSLKAGNDRVQDGPVAGAQRASGRFCRGFKGGSHDLSRGCSAQDIFKVAVMASACGVAICPNETGIGT